MREFLGFMLFLCLKFLFAFGVFAFFVFWFLSKSFNRDGSMSQEVVIIPAIIFTGMIVFFHMCISELKEANENLTVIASKVHALNQNIMAIYKQNKDHISFK